MISQPSWQADRKNVGAFFERWKNARAETADSERLVHDFLAVLDARSQHPGSSLADLYDPLTMPPELLKAHRLLDTAVMKLYGFSKDLTEPAIVAKLMERYQQLTTP